MLLSAYMQIFSLKIQCTAILDRMNLKNCSGGSKGGFRFITVIARIVTSYM